MINQIMIQEMHTYTEVDLNLSTRVNLPTENAMMPSTRQNRSTHHFNIFLRFQHLLANGSLRENVDGKDEYPHCYA